MNHSYHTTHGFIASLQRVAAHTQTVVGKPVERVGQLSRGLLQQDVGFGHIGLRHFQRGILPHHQRLAACFKGRRVVVAQCYDRVERLAVFALCVERVDTLHTFVGFLLFGFCTSCQQRCCGYE